MRFVSSSYMFLDKKTLLKNWLNPGLTPEGGRGGDGLLPDMGYIGMCRCEGYGFQAVYSGIGYINQRVLV